MKKCISLMTVLILFSSFSLAAPWQQKDERLSKIEQSLKGDVPNLLCINENFAAAGQPSEQAFGKIAENGYRSVLNLRTESEIDLTRERELVEKAGMRYISIPVAGNALKPELADQFLSAVKDTANHPMMIHCGSANRVGAFFMIYRVVEQGWPEDKALEEATQIGLRSPALKKFAEDYIAGRKKSNK
ncbi:MAG: protein tyrosine phosphatase family protein [Blastocatellia bacterium]|nr:protein tyrosine phosphatase family protein [Blastocatellia bacterium]